MSNTDFNPSLPLVSATEFLAGEKQIKVGDTVDLKALGISDEVALEWHRSGMVSHPEGAQAPQASGRADEPAEDVTVAEVIADVMAGDAQPAAATDEAKDTAKAKGKKR